MKVTCYTNCVVCESCFLCGDCRASVRGKYYCFVCIDLEAAEEVTVRALKRMDYAMSAKAAMIRQTQQDIWSRKAEKAAAEGVMACFGSRFLGVGGGKVTTK